ncbi:hypothetical protein Cni_G08635 [Canna indica]|uniref:Ubiquitin-like domain-containing protein n=1 Tax=Canna indica TaxID=4628 RepID=A0AAQ3Q6Z7_9LILI|nr:hypothetical protein Cni_G08635 [Canna indica]
MEAAKAAAAVAVEDEEDEFEPLFNYTHVRPADLLAFQGEWSFPSISLLLSSASITTDYWIWLEDDLFDSPPIITNGKRKNTSEAAEAAVVVIDDDEEEIKAKNNGCLPPASRKHGNSGLGLDPKRKKDEDWLPPPPPRIPNSGLRLQEDKTLQELRLYKQELAAFAQSAQDALQQVVEGAKQEHNNSGNAVEETIKQVQRQKIVISIQDKEGQKQFRLCLDDKFQRLFKMYAEKVQIKLDNLVFSFDGDKVDPNATPEALGMEDEDIIEVHVKSN